MKRNWRYFIIGGLSLSLSWMSCTSSNNKPKATEDGVTQKDVRVEAPPTAPIKIAYSAFPLKGVDSAVQNFKKRYKQEEQDWILALNRVDGKNIKRVDTLILPDTLLSDFNQYSPFPQSVPELASVHKIVIFSYPIQAFAAYDQGKLVYWGPTSMGSKIHPTPTGLFFANWKAEETISTVDDEWKLKWNFNIENKEGVGWHEYTMPGYPASHSCLRMLEKDARWMYNWADQWIVKGENNILAQGTPVIVFGAYPFGSRRPWRNQLNDPQANVITREALKAEIDPFLSRVMEQQQRRDSVSQNKEN